MAPKRYGDKITQEISGPNGRPIESIVNDAKMERFCDVKAFVENLRATVSDPEMRARIIDGLPDAERKDAGFAGILIEGHTAILAQALEKGWEAAALVQPPASFRGMDT